jgi:hypothetical protein
VNVRSASVQITARSCATNARRCFAPASAAKAPPSETTFWQSHADCNCRHHVLAVVALLPAVASAFNGEKSTKPLTPTTKSSV